MSDLVKPTTKENAPSRLFLRFFLLYFAGVALAVICYMKGAPTVDYNTVGVVQSLLVLLVVFAALTVLANPLLAAIMLFKAFFDVALVREALARLQDGARSVAPFNGLLGYLAFSLVLLSITAALSGLFSFNTTKRDMDLLLSSRFWLYLLRAALCALFAIPLYYFWPPLAALLG